MSKVDWPVGGVGTVHVVVPVTDPELLVEAGVVSTHVGDPTTILVTHVEDLKQNSSSGRESEKVVYIKYEFKLYCGFNPTDANIITKVVWAIYQLCQSMPGTAQGQAGTSKDKTGTNRNIPFMSLLVPTCPCLSMIVHNYPCLSLYIPACPCPSLSVLVCPCLSMYFSKIAIPSCLPLQMTTTVFVSMYIVKLTFLAKGTVPMHANFNFNFFFTFHLASSTLSLNLSSSILVINTTEGSTWFFSSFSLL